MAKKVIIAITFILCASFITTYSFATDEIKNGAMDAAQNVRNAVGDVENGVENAAKGAAGAIKKGTGDIENAGENVTGDMKKGSNNIEADAKNTMTSATTGNGGTNDGYTATRTSTGMFGTSNTMWTWLILAIVAVAIVGLIWYYSAQKSNSHDEY